LKWDSAAAVRSWTEKFDTLSTHYEAMMTGYIHPRALLDTEPMFYAVRPELVCCLAEPDTKCQRLVVEQSRQRPIHQLAVNLTSTPRPLALRHTTAITPPSPLGTDLASRPTIRYDAIRCEVFIVY